MSYTPMYRASRRRARQRATIERSTQLAERRAAEAQEADDEPPALPPAC